MTRILADLSDEDIQWLDQIAADQGKSRAAVLREAVKQYKAHSVSASGKEWLDQAFGIWKDRSDIGDPVEWQRRERASSTRSWDDDYEEVKAEFPDLFTEHDDRQRQAYLETIGGKAVSRKSGKSGKKNGKSGGK
jgi:predicted transcriptional regulator